MDTGNDEEHHDNLTDHSAQDSEEDEVVAEDEVIISSDGKGDIMAHASQVTDYCLQSPQFKNLTLWDFIAQIDKVNKTVTNKKKEDFFDSELDSDSEDINELDTSEENHSSENRHEQSTSQGPPLTVEEIQKLLHSCSRTHRKCELQENHPESHSHCLQARKSSSRSVTIPIGPHIPHHDKKKQYPKFCRLMLMFFKPWHEASDLHLHGLSWDDAFSIFMADCPSEFKDIIKNMQILHECKDSRDDHFKNQ
jgi:hypothetical protein